jgi:hypothetical protein
MQVTDHTRDNMVGALTYLYSQVKQNHGITGIEQNATRVEIDGFTYTVVVKIKKVCDD